MFLLSYKLQKSAESGTDFAVLIFPADVDTDALYTPFNVNK